MTRALLGYQEAFYRPQTSDYCFGYRMLTVRDGALAPTQLLVPRMLAPMALHAEQFQIRELVAATRSAMPYVMHVCA